MARLFIRDFNRNATQDDLKTLFNKVCPVNEVYLPGATITGIHRNFAVVTLNGDIDSINKCIKAFNGSIWMGSKIRIEMANCWYKDRLLQEKLDASALEMPPTHAPQAQIPSYALWESSLITLKKSFYAEPFVVSTKPTRQIRKSSRTSRTSDKVVPCGVKTILDGSLVVTTDESDSESENDEIDHPSGPEFNAVKLTPAELVVASPKTSFSAASSHLQGGGLRRGFGTLINKNSTASDKTVLSQKLSSHDTSSAGAPHASVDCCTGADLDHGDDDHYVEDDFLHLEDGAGASAPCVSAAELEEAALAKERSRALELMQSVLRSGDREVDSGGSSGMDGRSGAVTDPLDGNSSSLEAAAVSGAPSSASSVGHSGSEAGGMVARSGWNSVVMKRFDPSKSKKASSDSSQPAVGVAAPVGSSSSAPPTETAAAKDAFAATDKLKSIFQKEGGVWWADGQAAVAGSFSEVQELSGVQRGTVDTIFLEAEKLGIDVRGSTNGGDRAVDSVASGALFNFFQDESSTATIDGQPPAVPMEACNDPSLAAEPRPEEADVPPALTEDQEKRVRSAPVTPDELRALAKRFCRIKSLEEIARDWQEGRDRLVLDYKRKRKDALKRKLVTSGGARAEPAVVKKARPALSKPAPGAVGKYGAHAKKRRGGVKHSNKR